MMMVVHIADLIILLTSRHKKKTTAEPESGERNGALLLTNSREPNPTNKIGERNVDLPSIHPYSHTHSWALSGPGHSLARRHDHDYHQQHQECDDDELDTQENTTNFLFFLSLSLGRMEFEQRMNLSWSPAEPGVISLSDETISLF